jgi:lysyl-tRNA synthetase class 2
MTFTEPSVAAETRSAYETTEQNWRHNSDPAVNGQLFGMTQQQFVRSESPSPWWTPAVHADRRPFLLARARILAAVRRLFEGNEFIEVEPGVLQASPGNETHLSGFSTELIGPGGARRLVYLHTSPEFACKKLLSAGERKIFALTRVFRNRDCGPLHCPEFTMLEWYRAEAPLAEIEMDCARLLEVAANAAGAGVLRWRDAVADPFLAPERISVAEAFERFAGIDLLAAVAADGTGDLQALEEAARGLGLRIAPDDDWSDLFSKIMSDRIEPQLGRGRATLLYDYPVSEAALARRSPRNPRLAERFELYCCGVELANAFGELTDPTEQRRRFLQQMDERERIYGERYPLDEDFLSALALMPDASGCALGVDRLVMLATGAERIDQVAWTPAPVVDGT